MNNRLTNVKLLKTYYFLFAASAITFFIMLFVSNGESFRITLFRNSVGSDFFMDFFNSIRDGSRMDVYKNRIIYPPLANMFFYLLSRMINPELASAPFSKRMLLQRDYVCLFLYFVFVIIMMIMFIGMVKKYFEKHNLQRFSMSIPIMLLFSYPMIYCIQRGNIALLSMVFTMFFIFYRNSENKVLRELSFILLAVAAGIKIYPAAFGVLLITDRKFKHAARLVLYGILCFVLPFFFYDGVESMVDLINNLQLFSTKSSNRITPAFVSIDVLIMYAHVIFDLDKETAYSFLSTVVSLVAVVIILLAPKDWQKVWAISYIIMNRPSTARTYILILAIIPFVMFICSQKFRKRDIPYYVMFILMLLVIPPVYYNLLDRLSVIVAMRFTVESGIAVENLTYLGSPNQLLAAFMVTGMTMYMFVDILVGIARNEIPIFTKKKTKKVEAVQTENNTELNTNA